MAWLSNDARDIPPDITRLVCHTKRKCGVVVCILCDGGWCRSDFNEAVKQGKGFYVSQNIIVCPAHGHIAFGLLDDVPSSESREVVLLQRKMLLLQKHIECVENGGVMSQDLDVEDEVTSVTSDTDSVLSVARKHRIDDEPDVVEKCASCVLISRENGHLREMNIELKQSNAELRESNVFLRAIERKNEQSVPAPSFSSIVAGEKRPPDTAQFIVQPKGNYGGDVLGLIQNEISKQRSARVINIKKIKENKIIVKCVNKCDSDMLANTLQKSQEENLTVSQIVKKNPQIKIIDVSSSMDLEKPWKQLQEDILTRNGLTESDFRVVYSFRQRNAKFSLIAEVSNVAYAKIMKYRSIFVGYQNCRVFDDYNDRNCKKCCGYGHGINKCPRKSEGTNACPRCSLSHDGSTCNAGTLACINCISANRYLRKKRDVQHSAHDRKVCDTYRARWEKHVSMTDYPWRPEEPFHSSGNK